MRLRWVFSAAILGLLVNLPMGAQAAAPVKYRSTLIADTSSLFVGLSSTVPLNSSGSVAFFAYLRGGGVGIFTGNGGSITTIADTNNPLLTFGFSGIAFNNMGTSLSFGREGRWGRSVCWQWRANYHDCGFEQGHRVDRRAGLDQ